MSSIPNNEFYWSQDPTLQPYEDSLTYTDNNTFIINSTKKSKQKSKQKSKYSKSQVSNIEIYIINNNFIIIIEKDTGH